MEANLIRQVRQLQVVVAVLLVATLLLVVNLFHPLVSRQRFKLLEAERINVREADGTLRAALSNAAGFREGDRAKDGGTRIGGLMFYNEEGEETGGLVYRGRAIPGGQDADVSLTMDQYRQDQVVYLHHEEFKDSTSLKIDDGLTVNQRPDFTGIKQEYDIYGQLEKLSPEAQDSLKLRSLQDGRIGTRRLFLGVQRGVRDHTPYNDAGVFIKNRWGQYAIKLYVDNDNKPHFEVYDPLGKTLVYELKLQPAAR